jgi:hypothetical protein
MRPTGVTLIAVYHFLSAVFMVLLAIGLGVGGTVLGAAFAGGGNGVLGGLGAAVGIIGAIAMLIGAGIAAVAGYGIWVLREWGRILSIVLAGISLLFALPGLFFVHHVHTFFLFGSVRLVHIALDGLIIWYLVQAEIKALFQGAARVAPSA